LLRRIRQDSDEYQRFTDSLPDACAEVTRVLRKPPCGIAEDDDITSIDFGEEVAELVDGDAIIDKESVLHRTRWDIEELDQEGLDDDRDDDCNRNQNRQLPKEGSPALRAHEEGGEESASALGLVLAGVLARVLFRDCLIGRSHCFCWSVFNDGWNLIKDGCNFSLGDCRTSRWHEFLSATTLTDLRSLTSEISEEVELGSTNLSATNDFDLLDHWCMDREDSLDSDTIGDLSDGEGLANARTLASDDDSLEDLDTALVAFDDSNVDFQLISGAECRYILSQRRDINRIKDVHGNLWISLEDKTCSLACVSCHRGG
jgi:hypothetical protein